MLDFGSRGIIRCRRAFEERFGFGSLAPLRTYIRIAGRLEFNTLPPLLGALVLACLYLEI